MSAMKTATLAGVVFGALALGAATAPANAQFVYPAPPVYVAPPVYCPPPVYYAPPPVYYRPYPAYRAYSYGGYYHPRPYRSFGFGFGYRRW